MRNQIAHGYGSSPHTRGTHRWNDAMMGRYRFIPAYAGNALSSGKKRSVLTVHPRIRGERTFLKFCRMADGGSSPHTRGTRREPERMEPVGRFIPAYAGNARVRTEPASSSPVHPRIRGERPSVLSAGPSPYGSSPHTRGTPGDLQTFVNVSRFIPAYAGNACTAPGRLRSGTVHPRIRGERLLAHIVGVPTHGSSPHTRGTPSRWPRTARPTRFIPAYAGNAALDCPEEGEDAVHPRIRGERKTAGCRP